MTFVWPVRVYYEDTDAGGVVYYANYLRFMERARTEWLRSLGLEQQVLMSEAGILFAVRRAEVDYLRPARLDDALQVVTEIDRLAGASLDFLQSVRREGETGALCRARVQVVCLRAGDLRPTRIPRSVIEKFQPHH